MFGCWFFLLGGNRGGGCKKLVVIFVGCLFSLNFLRNLHLYTTTKTTKMKTTINYDDDVYLKTCGVIRTGSLCLCQHANRVFEYIGF